MGETRAKAIVLDSGALIAFERGNANMRALVRESLVRGVRLIVPAGVVAQVVHDTVRQVLVRALLRGPTTKIVPLDHALAEASGVLCGRAGTSDVIDASVVLVARRERASVVTSDVGDLQRLDPRLVLVRI